VNYRPTEADLTTRYRGLLLPTKSTGILVVPR